MLTPLSERISIKDLSKLIINISGKDLNINFIDGPTGVEGRSSDNDLIQRVLGWSPSASFKSGLDKTYPWVYNQVTSTSIKTNHKNDGRSGKVRWEY